jgi:hypothetical protein
VKLQALYDDPLSANGHKTGYVDVEEITDLVAPATREVLLAIPIDGTLSAGQLSRRFPLGLPGTIRSVSLAASTGPTGAALIVSVRKNAASIFATPANPDEPFIADGDFDSPAFGPLVTDFVAGDYLDLLVQQVGSSVAGAGLTAMVHLFLTGDEEVITPTTPPTLTAYQATIRSTAGVIAYWRFNELVGALTAVDDIGNYDGSYNGTYTLQSTGLLTTESDKGVIAATGTPDGIWIDMPSLPIFTATDPFSFEGWFKPSIADANFRRVFDQLGLTGVTDGYTCINVSDPGFYFSRKVANVEKVVASTQVPINTPTYFAVTYDGTNLRLYRDGTLAATTADSRSMPVTAPGRFRVGSRETGGVTPSANAYGTFDEFAVYDVCLDAATIADHYTVGSGQQPLPPPPPPPEDVNRINRTKYSKVALYAPLNETAGTTVTAQKKRLLFFEKAGFVNGTFASDATVDPDPDNFKGQLWGQAITPGPGFNTSTFSKPIYLADYDAPGVAVADTDGYMNADNSPYKWGSGANVPWQEEWRAADAETAMTTYKDRHLVIADMSADKLYELFGVQRFDTGPGTLPHRWDTGLIATHGGVAADLSTFTGSYPNPFGATGTGISALAGVVRYEEVVAGEIPHAIGFATARRLFGVRSPATRQDSAAAPSSGNRIIEGSIFRLDPTFDIDAYVTGNPTVPYLTELMIRAIQSKGMFCMDASGVLTFYGEDLRNPATGVYDGGYTNNLWYPHFVPRLYRPNITGVAATDVITSATNHNLVTGDLCFLYNLVGGAGATAGTLYYGRRVDATHFSLVAVTDDPTTGPLVDFTTNITAGQVGRVARQYELMKSPVFPWGSIQYMPEYDFNNTHRVASTFNDLTGTHSGAVTPGAASLTTNTGGKSATYTGGKTTFTDQPVFDVGATCTIRAITKTTTVAAGEAIILHRDVYELKRSGSSLIGSVTIGAVVKSVTATSVFAANTMADVALTYDGANVKLWKNGVQAGSSTAATGSVDASSDAIVVGSLADTTKAFNGQLQHVEVLQEALPVGRLAADYTAITT